MPHSRHQQTFQQLKYDECKKLVFIALRILPIIVFPIPSVETFVRALSDIVTIAVSKLYRCITLL